MVEGAGNDEITGAVLSSTLIVCARVDILPHASVAVHVLVTEYSPAHGPGKVWSLKTRLTAPPQPSLAVAVAKDGVAGHWITEGAGNEEITGAVLSSTIMVCEAVDELPQPSVDVQVLLTEYSCGHAPRVVTSWNESVAPLPQPSELVAIAKDGIAGQNIVDVAGSGLMTGAVTSITLIVCEAVDTLPQASVAVQVLVIEYCPAHRPGVVTVFCVSVNGVPHASVAVATAKDGVAGHCIVDGAGNAAITGAVTSRTVMT